LDPLTHLLTGACLGRAGLNRHTALATAVTTIAAEMADIDIMLEINGPVFGFQHHRGFTHTFLGVPFDAALALLVVYGWYRLRRRSGKPPKSPPRWGLLYGFACIAALSHLLLDFTNSYGVRPFMPFNYRWYHWDIVSIIEPVLLVVLIAALALPRLFALIQEEIGAQRSQGRAAAIVALVLMTAVWGLRDFQHRRALAALGSMTYQGEDAIRISAFPKVITPFGWQGVVETDDFFESMPVDTLQSEVDPQRRGRIYYKPEETPVTQAAKASYLGRVYLDWADYPMTEQEHQADGSYLVRFLDLRYVDPDRSTIPLRAEVLLNDKLEVIGERFGGFLVRPRMRPARR
jgi:inner membrane protein